MKKYIQKILIVFVSCLIFLGFAGNVLASTTHSNVSHAASLSVAPSLNDLGVIKGQTYNENVTIANNTPYQVILKIYSENFGTTGYTGNIIFYQQTSKLDTASGWFSVTNPVITLSPYGKQTIPVTIAVPKDADPGEYYVSLFFQQDSEGINNTGVHIVPRIGSLFFVNVLGSVHSDAAITNTKVVSNSINFPLIPSQILSGDTVNFDVYITNKGNIHIQPQGKVQVYDIFNHLVDTLTIPTHIILPGNTRDIETQWLDNKVLIGGYTVKTQITYGVNQESKFVTTFYAFHVPHFGLILLSTVLLFGSIIILRKRYDLWSHIFLMRYKTQKHARSRKI